MDDIQEWLDEYELLLAEEHTKESPPLRELLKGWQARFISNRDDGHWYEFER